MLAFLRDTVYNGCMMKNKDTASAKPRKKGRPSLGDDARIHFVSLRVSMNEIREWTAKAEAMGMALREYILLPHRKKKKRKG